MTRFRAGERWWLLHRERGSKTGPKLFSLRADIGVTVELSLYDHRLDEWTVVVVGDRVTSGRAQLQTIARAKARGAQRGR